MRDNWLLDVAHNPAASAALAATLREQAVPGRTIAILGMLRGKDVAGVVAPLSDLVDAWIAVTADNVEAVPAEDLARQVANASNRACLIADSLEDAIAHARSEAEPGGRVLVTGSFYLVGPVLERLSRRDL